jgi:hypothetical protein
VYCTWHAAAACAAVEPTATAAPAARPPAASTHARYLTRLARPIVASLTAYTFPRIGSHRWLRQEIRC